MEQSLSREIASRSSTHDFPGVLGNPKFHYRAHKGLLLDTTQSEMNLFYAIQFYFSKINFNVIIPLSAFLPQPYMRSCPPHTCYMLCLPQPL
jgi:hypothetical protein